MSELAKASSESTMAQRFTNAVIAEFKNNAGEITATNYQRSLVQGYYVKIDQILKKTEEDRTRGKTPKNSVPCTWNNVNMQQLSLDVMHYSKVGLDMLTPNHLNPIPFLNSKTKKYDIGFIVGYEGIKYETIKYAADKPLSVTTELVHKNDTFKVIKKNTKIPFDTYEFMVTNPFDRGDVIGAFGYIEYDKPQKNQLIIMSLADIMKRKPKSSSVEFWGGNKAKWENGQKIGEENVEGWPLEMMYKTVVRYVYGKIEIDPVLIDENYQAIRRREAELAEDMAKAEIAENANTMVIDIEATSAPEEAPAIEEQAQDTAEKAPDKSEKEQAETDGDDW